VKRVTKLGRGTLRKARARAGRVTSAMSRRLAPPADIAPREELFAYWRQPRPKGNAPADLLGRETRSRALLSMLDRVVGTEV
jgi:hypothetical protein